MAYVRREILATSILASPLIKFANFISRVYTDYADEIYKPLYANSRLCPSAATAAKFFLLALSASLSRSVFTLAQSIAQPNLKDKFHSRRLKF